MKLQSVGIAALLAIASTSTVFASDLCNVPEADRQPIEALQKQLEDQGWEVKNMKVDDGCYEAYAIDDKGEKVEVYFDPKTFAIVKKK